MDKTVVKGKNSIPGWETNGLVEFISGGPQPGGMFFPVAHGIHAVRLGNDASISQTVPNLKSGSLYVLSFVESRTCVQNEVLRVSVPPKQAGDLPLQTLYCSNGGDTYAWGFKASGEEAKVVFHNPGAQEDPAYGPLVDSGANRELFPSHPTRDSLVKNPGFEEGPRMPRHNNSNGILLPPNHKVSPLSGWIIEYLKAVKYIDAKHYNVPFGQSAVELVAGRERAITQIIHTVVNKVYSLTFTVGDGRNECHGSKTVVAFAARETFTVPFESKGKGEFKTVTFKFTISNRTRVTFFSSQYQTRKDDFVSLCGPVVDQAVVLPFN